MFTNWGNSSHFCQPTIMGILNCTPDSFAVHCAAIEPDVILHDCEKLVEEGADIVDIGTCSTRPGAELVSEEEEWRRLEEALPAIRQHFPTLKLSLDTFRSSIAERAITQYGVNMINDVSGAEDERMIELISRTHVPYVLTHSRKACEGWKHETNITANMLYWMAHQIDRLHQAGITDVVVDPGLGFGKSVEQNYTILHHLGVLKHLGVPVMVGLSRKRMIYEPLASNPKDALIGTISAQTIATLNGANIVRVHDVAEAIIMRTILQNYLRAN